jgi:hypothetical protein
MPLKISALDDRIEEYRQRFEQELHVHG